MSRWFRICEAKGGRGCFRLSYGRSKFTLFSKKKNCKCGVTKNKHGPNFQNIASKTNQLWLMNYEKLLIHFGADILKIVAVLVFCDPHNFANALTQLRDTKTKIGCTHLSYTFLILCA